MPMIPSPFAAAVYGTIKILGYTAYASALNKAVKRPYPPIKFGFAKTFIGFCGGLLYLFFIAPHFAVENSSDLTVLLSGAPIRFATWSLALTLFYKLHQNPTRLIVATILGTAYSYVLDLAMFGLYKIVPGMSMPFC